MIKVSVVVPVYNQEKYIERCLDSILAQSMQEMEVILVDDGSTDSTADILSRYEQKDERIIVLHQKNQYAGAARNNGLRTAKGEYVIFWDSDDYFQEDALEVLYDASRKYDADICVGDATRMDLHTGTVREKCYLNWSMIPDKRTFSIEDVPQHIFNFARNYLWNRLYRRSFLEEHNLWFSELKQSEDVPFVMKAFVLAKKITVVDHVIVYYQFRSAGSLSGNALKNKESVLAAHLEVKKFLEESGHWENQDIRQSFVNNAFATIASQFAIVEDQEDYKTLYYFYKEKALPALGLGMSETEQMYSDKNAWELSCMLSCDVQEYLFKQCLYYQNRTQYFRDKLSRVKGKLDRTSAQNLIQKEKIDSLKLDKAKKTEKIRVQREKIEAQRDKIQRQSDKIQRQNDKIQRQSDKIQRQSDKIQRQSALIQDQKALLDKKLVRAALKVHNSFHSGDE